MSSVIANKFVLCALAFGTAAVAAIAPAQASDFNDDGYRKEVVVIKKSVAQPSHDFDDEEQDVRRSVVMSKRVYHEDEEFDRSERVIVKERVVQPITVVRRIVQPVKVIVRERVVQPVTVVKRVVQPVHVVTKRVVHSGYGYGHPHAGYRYSDF